MRIKKNQLLRSLEKVLGFVFSISSYTKFQNGVLSKQS